MPARSVAARWTVMAFAGDRIEDYNLWWLKWTIINSDDEAWAL